MLTIQIRDLQPSSQRLTGSAIGEAHFEQIRSRVGGTQLVAGDAVILDFVGISAASASYLKRLLNPFYVAKGEENPFEFELAPILANIEAADLREDLDDYFEGKGLAIAVGAQRAGKLRCVDLVGRLERAAEETLFELRSLGEATALQLYQLFPSRTTNQTAWNNRLARLVELRLARRRRDGRIWKYEPILTT